jgi:predicted DsbA family dithiol-disulfide isomerase
MKIDIWSDVVCPFCYIGKRKFEKALENFNGKDKVEVEWHSFQLDPDLEYVPGQSVHEYLGKRKGATAAEGKQMNDAMTAMAKEVELEYNFDQAIINNTFNAHRLLHFAKEKGLQNEMKERLFRAYYTEGKNIGDIDTLAQLAEEVGLQAEEAKKVLQSDAYAQDVLLDQYQAQQLGIQGVPFFVFNNKYGISGAQPTAIFAQVLDKVWEEEKPVLITEEGEGFCTVDGACN